MLDRVLRFFIIMLLSIAGGALLNMATPLLTFFISTEILETEMGFFKLSIAGFLSILFGAALGAAFGFLLSPFFIRKLKGFAVFVEAQLSKMPTHDVIAGAIGLLIGLIIANLLGYAFSKIPVVGTPLLTFGLLTFAFSTILGWCYYGERAVEYLKGKRWVLVFRVLYMLAVFAGSVMNLAVVWNLADCMNALMAIPNLISLLCLNGILVHETRKYLWRHRLDMEM